MADVSEHNEPPVRLVLTGFVQSLTKACETHCVAACCGVAAYEVSHFAMTPWVRSTGLTNAKEALGQLDGLVQQMTELAVADNSCLVSSAEDDFNTTWTPAECREYLDGWRQALERAVAEVEGRWSGGIEVPAQQGDGPDERRPG
jgi:hypothetical protein